MGITYEEHINILSFLLFLIGFLVGVGVGSLLVDKFWNDDDDGSED